MAARCYTQTTQKITATVVSGYSLTLAESPVTHLMSVLAKIPE